jgi:N6-adenosine-specific RNA methylase IME4
MWVIDEFLLPNTRYTSSGCFAVLEAWGFEYSSIGFVWVKTGQRLAKQEPLFIVADNKNYPRGMGHTTRKGAEICLLGVRGKFGRDRKDVSQVLFAPRARHSEKPVEQYALIERLMGDGPYCELFARQHRSGWDVAFSPEADSGPGNRRWASNSYPDIQAPGAPL